MGQVYCETCCGQKGMDIYTTMGENNKTNEADLPHHEFAKPVRQQIEVTSKVKEVYSQNRTSHIPERKGKRLDLFYLFSYAAYYDGEWNNGLPDGFGRLIYDDGSVYEGCFENGSADCKDALFVKNNGTFYKGEVKGSKANGFGALHTEKFYYKGHWLNDLPHGEGQEVYMRGQLPHYEGNFQKGKKHGQGVYHWNQKEYYAGEFKNNLIHGYGKHVTKDLQYTGTFHQGEKHGSGKLCHLAQKWTYEGQFKHNKMNGKGIFTWEDGTKFQGTFVDNKQKNGQMSMVDGEILEVEG